MESVKNLLLNDEIKEARQLAIERFYGRPPLEIIELFKTKIIEAKKCECGNFVKGVFNNFVLDYNYLNNYCTECHNKYELEKLEKEKIKIKQAELDERKAWDEFNEKKDQIVIDIARQCGVPPKLRRSVITKPPIDNYFITGNIGTGKSYLAAGLLKNYISQIYPEYTGEKYKININLKPIFVNVPELLLNIRECFNLVKKTKRFDEARYNENPDNFTEKGLIDHYTNTPFLVLDDLGIEKTSEWSLQTLYIILNRRYEESDDKLTIITSNLNLNDISRKLDDRIGSRINGMCKTLKLTGKDMRLDHDQT